MFLVTLGARSRADGHEVLMVWGCYPCPAGDSKGIFSLPGEQEAAELMFLVHQELQAQPVTLLGQDKTSSRKLLFRGKYLFGKCHLRSSGCSGCFSSGENEVCNAWNWCLDQL